MKPTYKIYFNALLSFAIGGISCFFFHPSNNITMNPSL